MITHRLRNVSFLVTQVDSEHIFRFLKKKSEGKVNRNGIDLTKKEKIE